MNAVCRTTILTALTGLFAASALYAGFGYKPKQLYEGEKRPDAETAALIHGYAAMHEGDQWVAMLIGVDGKLCPAQTFTSDNDPTPKNLCGNISAVLPGSHELTYAIQTVNKISLATPYVAGSNSWNRLDHPVTAKPLELNPGILYAARPANIDGNWTVTLEAVCPSVDHSRVGQWFISRQTCR